MDNAEIVTEVRAACQPMAAALQGTYGPQVGAVLVIFRGVRNDTLPMIPAPTGPQDEYVNFSDHDVPDNRTFDSTAHVAFKPEDEPGSETVFIGLLSPDGENLYFRTLQNVGANGTVLILFNAEYPL